MRSRSTTTTTTTTTIIIIIIIIIVIIINTTIIIVICNRQQHNHLRVVIHDFRYNFSAVLLPTDLPDIVMMVMMIMMVMMVMMMVMMVMMMVMIMMMMTMMVMVMIMMMIMMVMMVMMMVMVMVMALAAAFTNPQHLVQRMRVYIPIARIRLFLQHTKTTSKKAREPCRHNRTCTMMSRRRSRSLFQRDALLRPCCSSRVICSQNASTLRRKERSTRSTWGNGQVKAKQRTVSKNMAGNLRGACAP
jgi:K+-sensing histidine kinase KdpD